MDFKEIIEQQKKLDEAIKKAHSINIEHTDKMLIALYTEIGEFANEVQSFKYWKKSKKINLDNLLEEYADGLHFLMSFSLKYGCSEKIDPIIKSEDVNNQFLYMFNSVSKLTKKITRKRIEQSIGIYLGLAKLTNLSDKQVLDAYMKKNKKNFERIKNNY